MNDPLGTFSLSEKDARHLAEKFRAGRPCFVQSLPLSAQAYLALSIHNQLRSNVLWILDSPKSLDLFQQDTVAIAGGREDRIAFFPARESTPGRSGQPPPDLIGDRLKTLQRCLKSTEPLIISTCIQALLQPAPAPDFIRKFSLELSLTQEIDLDDLAARLDQAGYSFEAEVLQKGQASRRGGLIDIWPPTEPWPIRMEFFGPVLDSIRTFDPVGQRSIERLSSVVLAPAEETVKGNAERSTPNAEHRSERAGCGAPASSPSALDVRSSTFDVLSDLLSYLPQDTLITWSEPDSLFHHAEMFGALDAKHRTTRYDDLRLRAERSFKGGQLVIGLDSAQSEPSFDLDLKPCEGLPTPAGLSRPERGDALEPDVLDSARRKFVEGLERQAAQGRHVYFFFNTEGVRDRFREIYKPGRNIHVRVNPLSEGFVSEPLNLTVIAESDLYGFRKNLPGRYELHGKRPGARAATGARIAAWTDIQPGELVVHVDHGIGKYLGLYEIEFDGQEQEVLAIEYAEKAKLYVPVSQTHLLSRYVGVGKRRPDLHALGGKRWTREKLAAENAVRDLASALLETHAHREALGGHAFSKDGAWQHEFEAAFPYQETDDQHQAILDTKQDMESRRPMDRLICGDVGYGKTEVAMRAAFKSVMDGKQVAVLVPTTVLAQQHFDTFIERMAAYPVSIEMLSRFRTRAQQAAAVRRVNEGAVDIVIGTHRLLQKDVKFKDLGLVIIDEEQRFGVRHKEHFKHLRELVDVLTLTATPIPRTLYMSLTGAKDMSTIQTPPQERLPIETLVAPNEDEIVRAAILRELNRGGQVFYLHNRVKSIHFVQDRLRKLVPEAKIGVGHGQMNEKELAAIMHKFVRGEFDLLLCTTIIESGVDIPNVNTILIDRADRFGMADLYQLRGRVGRYKHQAFAYLLLPRHGRLFDTARKRIGAIKRYSSLGAGFKLALRDLEIRGAGNLLGSEQSGHIAAVGFDLYCQLLKRTVAGLKGEKVPPIIEVSVKLDFIELSTAAEDHAQSAVIPSSFMEDENLRVTMYRKIAQAAAEPEIERLREELRDRFGPLPEPLERLLKIARLRILAATKGIQSIEVQGDKVMMMRQNDYIMPCGKFPRLKSADATARLEEMIGIVQAK